MYLISSELSALEEISKLCGEKKSKDKDKTASTPLVTVSDLQRLQQYETISLRLRTMPFKTKLVPNWKMDWGKKYENATFPTREKRSVALFDIREFVKEQKKKKMAEMMGDSAPSSDTSSTPFGTNPFTAPPAFSNNTSTQDKTSSNGGFNVDDLVKRIDAKIAELEEEERKEKEEKKNTESTENKESSNTESKPSITEEIKVPVAANNISSPETVNIDELSKEKETKLPTDNNDDDNFFDDFFADE